MARDRRINIARTMLRGDPEQRAKAIDDLERIIRHEPDSLNAQEARQLLMSCRRRAPVAYSAGDAEDPAVDRLRKQWRKIQDLESPILPHFFRDLNRESPSVIEKLLDEIKPDFRSWVAAWNDKANAEKTEVVDARTRNQLKQAVDWISKTTVLAEALKDETACIKPVVERLWFAEKETEFHQACRSWDTKRAHQILHQLNQAPREFDERIRALKKTLQDVITKAGDIDDLLKLIPEKQPETWEECLVSTDIYRSLLAMSKRLREPPQRVTSRLSMQADTLASLIGKFLKARASSARTLDDIETFFRRYAEVISPDETDIVPYDPSWFAAALSRAGSQIIDRVRRARGHRELDDLLSDLRSRLELLPEFARKKLSSISDEIVELARNWERMQAGEAFDSPQDYAGALEVPEAFRTKAPEYAEWLDTIDDTFREIRRRVELEDLNPFDKAREVAQAIIKKCPNHARAKELLAAANRGDLALRLDSLLQRFEFERFLEVCGRQEAEPEYSILLNHSDILLDLYAHHKKGASSSTEEAAAWWRTWKHLVDRLPANRPESLDWALDGERAGRRDRWDRILKSLVQNDLQPAECDKAIESLRNFGAELGFGHYAAKLESMRLKGLVRVAIGGGDLEEAEKRMETLLGIDPDDTITRGLKAFLDLEKARGANLAKVAGVLYEDWHSLLLYSRNYACETLLSSLEEAWRERDGAAIEELKKVAKYAGTSNVGESEAGKIKAWLEWLRLERTIITLPGESGVRLLLSYLEHHMPSVYPDPDEDSDVFESDEYDLLRDRLSRLVEEWEEREDWLMLTWAFRLFKRIDPKSSIIPGIDPVTRLREETQNVCSGVLDVLRKKDDLYLSDLTTCDADLSREEKRWDLLNVLLNLLPFASDRPATPESLAGTRDSLDKMIETVEKLERTGKLDLRIKSNYDLLARVRRIMRQIDIDNPVFRQMAQQEIARLDILTGLDFAEGQVFKTCSTCKRDDCLDQPGLFGQVADRVIEVIRKFEEANAVGGPMWGIVSRDYAKRVFREAGLYGSLPAGADLRDLVSHLGLMEKDEEHFRKAVAYLKKNQPPMPRGGIFNATDHLDVLSHIPRHPPRSGRVYQIFMNLRNIEAWSNILDKSENVVPEWVFQSPSEWEN
jgi:hypothetical protein